MTTVSTVLSSTKSRVSLEPARFDQRSESASAAGFAVTFDPHDRFPLGNLRATDRPGPINLRHYHLGPPNRIRDRADRRGHPPGKMPYVYDLHYVLHDY